MAILAKYQPIIKIRPRSFSLTSRRRINRSANDEECGCWKSGWAAHRRLTADIRRTMNNSEKPKQQKESIPHGNPLQDADGNRVPVTESSPASPLNSTGTPVEQKLDAGDRARKVRFELSPKTMVALVLVVASLWLLFRLWPILLVLIVALVVAGTLSPAVGWLEERRIRRGYGIAIVFTIFFIVALMVAVFTIPTLLLQGMALLGREPELRAQVADYFARSHLAAPFGTWLRGLNPDALRSAISSMASAYSLRFFSAVWYGVSALFLGLYIMIDRDRLRGGLFAIVPRSHHIRLSRIMWNLETIVGAYIRGQMVTCLLMAIATFVILKACGVENALALAVFAGVTDVLPFIGPFLATIPAVFAALARGPFVAIVVLALMFVYEEFESRMLVPRIYGRALRLPSSVVMFALLVGGTLMGILGALLALPVAATVIMLIQELRVELPGQQEQPADTRLREADERGEEEYERRTAGAGAEQSAAIAAEISRDRRVEESYRPETIGTTNESGNAKEEERPI